MQATLLDHDGVFQRFFAPYYRPGELARRRIPATFPDVARSFPPSTRVRDACSYDEGQRRELVQMIEGMVDAEVDACAERPEVEVPSGWRFARTRDLVAWIDSLDAFWTHERIAEGQTAAHTGAFQRACLGFGALLGATLVRMSRSEWLPRLPSWDSSVLHEPSGYEAYVFHWAMKKFSSHGVDDGFAAKLVTVYTTWEPW